MELTVFKNAGFEVRGGLLNSEPYFVAMDIAKALGYADTATMTRRLDDDEKGMQNLQTLGGIQNVTVISESGLYNSILGSNKPEAKQFKKWVTSEVLPTIRKHGAYATPETLENMIANPDFAISLLQNLKEERLQKEKALSVLEKQKPLVSFASSVKSSVNSVLIREYAQSIGLKEKQLREYFDNKGYIYRNGNGEWRRHATETAKKYFDQVPRTNSNHTGTHITYTVKITGEGQTALTHKVLEYFGKA